MSPINLTIKTLDSRNHPFDNLDPEMSIRELKEKISPTVSIPPERQRLIYCGRVLDDEKKLKDHALDGKVLHLVSRQPRSVNNDRGGFDAMNHAQNHHRNGPTPDVNITIRRRAPPFRATSVGGNNPVRAEMTRSSATIRLQLASRMLRRANGIIDSLDHPGREEEAATTSGAAASPAASPATSATSASSEGSSTSSTTTTTTTAASAATTSGATDPASGLSSLFAFNATGGETVIGTMAIQIETNGNNTTPGAAVIVQNDGLAPLQRIFRGLEQQQQQGDVNTSTASSETAPSSSSGTSTTVGGNNTAASSRTTSSNESSSSSTTSSSSSTSTTTTNTTNTTIEHPPPNALALVMEEYNRTNARLAPYTERMINLLRNDPELSESVVREHQIFYNYVTQAMHFMSHAQHAMSDILFNLSTPTPRVIRARPFLLHRPAFQNVAISATATPASRTTQSRAPTTATTATPSTATPNGDGGNSGNSTAPSAGGGGEIGFTVEARPIIVGIPNVRPGSNRAFIASETDFISNMIRATLGGIQNAVAGNNQGSGGGIGPSNSQQSSTSATITSSANSNGRGTSSSQRSSSDMNSGTQPTTSARTRSSPHVHYAATPMSAINPSTQMGHLNNFDPFLQCNSHHILGGRSGGMSGGVTGRWSTFDRHPIRRRTRHPAGFQIHHGAQQRSSSVPPNPGAAPNNTAATAAAASSSSSSSTPSTSDEERRSENQSSNTTTQPPPTAPRSEEAPYLRRMALAQGIRELVLDQVMNYNAPPNATGGSSATPSSNDDQVMFNIIQGILRYFVGALDLQAAEGNSSVNTVSTGNETMEQFLRSLPDYNYVEGESVITDLLMTIIRHLTFRDLVTWIFGGGDRIINQFREPLAAFVRGQLSQNDNIEESVTGFLDSYYPQVEEISNLASVSPDIDFAETLHNFMSERLLTLVQIVLRETEVDSFGRDISRQVSDLFTGLTALGMHSFTDGPASIERVVQSQLGALCGHGLGPVARDQLMSIATGHLRNYIGGLGANSSSQEEDISRYIIKKGPDADRRKSERNKRIASQNNQVNNASVEDERFVTPPSSPEVMEVEEEDSSNKAPDTTTEPSSSSVPEDVDPNQKFPPELLKMAQGPDMVIGSETWHKSLPTEWVPIITRDISRQQRRKSSTTTPPSSSSSNATAASTSSSTFAECVQESFVQAPFSDAYLGSQSAKRRKLAAAKKPEVGSDLENVIAESLNEALSETGVMTLVDVDTIAGSPDVVRSVEVKTKNVIKEKLSKDLDFANSPESRFRSSKAFSSSKD